MGVVREAEDDSFIVRFETWEGPIEALLDLARSQKVDLARIDVLELVGQFEAVLDHALGLRLELAADWLVMAAWLAYLKSRILLRKPKEGRSEPQDEDVLAYHLKRLAAVRRAAEVLPERLILGRDWFAPAGAFSEEARGSRLGVSFHDFLRAYPQGRERSEDEAEQPIPILTSFDVETVDVALSRLSRSLPSDWINLLELVPASSGSRLRSSIAASLVAALELARDARAEVEQQSPSSEIMVRRHE